MVEHPTLKTMMNEIVDYGSCCECGSCVLVCPHNVIDYVGEMGIPLSDIRQFNVKGKVIIYKKSGEVVDLSLRKAQEYACPECHHCGDFSGELADISCGGVGTNQWTIVIPRTRKGEEVFDAMVAEGLLEVKPMEEFANSMKVLLRLARKQHQRVPVPPGREESFVRPAEFIGRVG